ncbi:MAG: flagellar filament capping protein FliD [Spirochaetaceae bacterium]|jgi:flagellar hook-associated protein 2|nr:flagellar filament capping protein FliD [Spirochaetaceae bacterium]
MPDISIPGVKSRFDTDKTIEALMQIERIPRNRVEKSVETMQGQKTTWQTLGRRISDLRDGANQLFSYQNPFNDRSAESSDTTVLDVTASREARAQEHDFTIRQIAKPDRFMSNPLDKEYKVAAGNYSFKIGETEVSFKFQGGGLREFTDAIKRRSNGKLSASTLSIKQGTYSLIIGSEITGKDNKLVFEKDALKLALSTGMVEQKTAEPVTINIKAAPAAVNGQAPETVVTATRGDSLKAAPMSETQIAFGNIEPSSSMVLKFETSVSSIEKVALPSAAGVEEAAGEEGAQAAEGETAEAAGENAEAADAADTEQDALAAGVEEAGEAAAADAEAAGAAEEGASAVELQPPESLAVIALKFTDGTSVDLPAIRNGEKWSSNTFNLFEISGGKTVSMLEIKNTNPKHEISIRNIQVLDPVPKNKSEPLNAVSTAQDAILMMDGIEIERPSNKIDDIVPGLTLNLKNTSEIPVSVRVEQDNKAVKEAVIDVVGNYNRLMAEINILTRSDDRVLNELTYIKEDEREEMRKRLGSLANDSSILKLKSDLISIVNSPYNTSADPAAMLASFGISTDARRSGATGYDPSRLRGYLEIDEKAFDEALASNFDKLRELMGRDMDGDLVIDSGLAYQIVHTTRPFVEIGGVIANKTQGLDSKIAADNRRIANYDRQLERKEADLRRQYAQMEDAYSRMERMTGSLDNFAAQNSNNKR